MRRLILSAGLLLVYFLMPVTSEEAPAGLLLGTVLGVIGLGGVAWVVATEVQRADKRLQPIHLLLALELVVIIFSAANFLLAVMRPGEYTDLNTRLDGLYFTLTTVATVGYGDIHAVGQWARLIVTIQLVFNVAFVAAMVNLFKVGIRRRSGQAGRSADADELDEEE